MSYSYLIVDTHKGTSISAVEPSKVFTKKAVLDYLKVLEKDGHMINGWEVRHLDFDPTDDGDRVSYVDFKNKVPF